MPAGDGGCLPCGATGRLLEDATAGLDPFGSPSYDLALVQGKPKGGQGRATMICVYDKAGGKVEVGSAIDGTDN
ncbi:MAG TPA: hypothetical protein VHL31_26280 [Geminicoccus sp.]|jgi:hypothetical protein|uniref:hypothetical protein n=1 Tax=Geminicoccus sp. TaxID=2024832 RepID=UPI002E2F1656|nr:hypothetical protein [Geminicoccus sp.]HEX2529785.1 hypothetical protein [Geminicoccus sp.]